VPSKELTIAGEMLYYGTAYEDKKYSQNRPKPATHLLNDFNELIVFLMSEYSQKVLNIATNIRMVRQL
jgi:methyl coenzyme M reductase alpha subunit